MKNVRPVHISNWTSGLNEGRSESEMELDSRKTYVRRKPKKRNVKSFAQSLEMLRSGDSESSNNPTLINDAISAKKIVAPPKSIERRKLRSFGNIKASDLTRSAVIPPLPKAMDVVVDVHQEHKVAMPKEHQDEGDSIIKVLNKGDSTDSFLKSRVFSQRNAAFTQRINDKSKSPLQMFKKTDNLKLEEPFDLIEEFKEYSVNQKDKEEERDSTTQDLSESSPQEKPQRRKQWNALDVAKKCEDPRKPPRKRWSKDNSIIRLPENRTVSSTDDSSTKNAPPMQKIKKPVPAPRSIIKREAVLSGFENTAFVSDEEEVLRIETDHNQEKMKIEMRAVNELKIEELSPISKSHRNPYDKRKAKQDTIIVTERSKDSDKDSRILRSKENTIEDLENSGEWDTDGYSSREKILSRVSDDEKRRGRRSISREKLTKDRSEEETVESNSLQSVEGMSEKDTFAFSGNRVKKTKKAKKDSKIQQYSSQETISTNEDDEESEHCLTRERTGYFKRDFVTSGAKKRKSESEEEDIPQTKQKESKEGSHKEETSSSTYTRNLKEKKKKKKEKRKKKEEIKYISVTVHRADMLETDYITKHPMVKVHIVEAETGNYLKNVINETGSIHLQPIITGKFDFKENRSMIPVWEEELIFEHDFDSITRTENQIVILFEIIDLLSFAEASFNYDKFGSEGCWYKIAWAFLKPVGVNNTMHTDKKVRLQLYRPRRSFKKFERHKCEVYTWWKSSNREKYPSSLFITITSVDPPKLEPVFYQQLSLNDLSDVRNESQKTSTCMSDSVSLPKWIRLAVQSCKIPNEKLFETEISENGYFYVVFSNYGKYLACINSEEYNYSILLYEVDSWKTHVRFSGHKTFVYSLNWSNDDTYLLSVSSDQTARMWDVQNKIVQYIVMLPHPAYVYCGKFVPKNSSIVGTGCFDQIVRIWAKDRKMRNYELCQELEGHDGFVNSMCFQKDGTMLTADSVGVIIMWTVRKNRRMPFSKEWHISRKIKVREIKGIVINTIVLHPLESRLLVHSRNNGLRMLDLATGVVLQKYTELNNQRIQSTACISPCGGLVLCGGEDSSLNVWSLETGKYLATYTVERSFKAVTCVDYHPNDHILAFSTFGNPAPVRVLKFNKDANGEDVALKLMIDDETRIHSGDVTSFLDISLMTKERSRCSSRKRYVEHPKETDIVDHRSIRNRSRENGNDVLPEQSEKYEETKLKLQRLNETEQTLKSRSTNRLYNIIEKIDKILSNTSKSSEDLESGRSSMLLREKSESRVLTEWNGSTSKGDQQLRTKSKMSWNSNGEDYSSYVESIATGSATNEVFELQKSSYIKENEIEKRSRSAKETGTSKLFEDDIFKTLSDSATNSRKSKILQESFTTLKRTQGVSSFLDQPIDDNNRSDSLGSTISEKMKTSNANPENSPDSDGTYVIEKADLEKNKDLNSLKVSKTENLKDEMGSIKSGSSVLSNATFTVENENVPVAKPRRKKVLE